MENVHLRHRPQQPFTTTDNKEDEEELQKTSARDKTKVRSTLATKPKKLKLNWALNLRGENSKIFTDKNMGHEGIDFIKSLLHQGPQIIHKHLTHG